MVYLFGLAILVFALSNAPERSGLQRNNHRNYLILCGTAVALVAGLRTIYTGSPDTQAYTQTFFSQVAAYDSFKKYYDIYLGENGFLLSEAGFSFFMWLLSRVTNDGQWLVFLTSIFIVWATCRFIYENSSDVPLSLLIYVCWGLFTFNMNGMRQAVAMSICLLSYRYVKERNLFKFLLTIFFAMMFHKTALFFIPVFFIPLLKNTLGNWFVFTCILALVLTSLDSLIPWFNDATGKDYSTTGTSGGGITVIALYVFSVVMTVIVNPLHNRSVSNSFVAVLTAFAMYISRFFADVLIERASYYYFYFTMLLIPDIIGFMSPEEKKIIKTFFIIGTFLVFAYRLMVGEFRNFTFFFLE